MPAFSYKERFVPMIKDGSKSQTIRAFRKYLVKPGQTLSHFYGMRTKYCTRIIDNTICTQVFTIFILENGDVYFCRGVEKDDALQILNELGKKNPNIKSFPLYPFDQEMKDDLAWEDGFRVEGSTRENTAGCWDLMFRWWNQTHSLPFTGQLIKW